MDASVVVAVLAFFTSVAGIVVTNRYAAKAARRAQEAAERQKLAQVDAEAFARAREQYDAARTEQERRIKRLREEMEEDREEYRRDSTDCRTRIDSLDREINALRRWARTLLTASRAAGVQHPDPPLWLGSDTNPGLPRADPDR